jgi:hypothetical protein
VLSALNGEATSLVADAAYLYIGMYDGSILRTPKAGGALDVLAGVGEARLPHLAVDDTHVYWASLGMSEVGRVPKAGGAVEILERGLTRPLQVALDDTSVYWTEEGDAVAGGTGNGGRIAKRAKSKGPTTVLAAGQQAPNAIAIAGDFVVFASGPWGDVNGAIVRVPKAGGDTQMLARRLNQIFTLIVANESVYFVGYDYQDQGLQRVPLAGGAVELLGAQTLSPFGLAGATRGLVAASFDTTTRRAELRSITPEGQVGASLARWSYAMGVMPIPSQATVTDAQSAYWVDVESSGDFGMRSTLRSAPLAGL